MDNIIQEVLEKAVSFNAEDAESFNLESKENCFAQFISELLNIDCVFIDVFSETLPNTIERVACFYKGHFLSNINYPWNNSFNKEIVKNIKRSFHVPNAPLLESLHEDGFTGVSLKKANGDLLGFIGVMDEQPINDVKSVELILQILASKLAQEIEVTSLQMQLKTKDVEACQNHNCEERSRFTICNTGDSIWDWDIQTNKVYFSSSWKAMLGYNDDEIQDSHDEWEKIIHPEDKEKASQVLQTLLDSKTSFYKSEYRVLCKDGTYKWILSKAKVINRNSEGKALRVIGTDDDISERKFALIALEQREEALGVLADHIFNGLIVINSQGNHLYSNNRIKEILGYTSEDLKQFNYKELSFYRQYAQFQDEVNPNELILDKRIFETYIPNKEGGEKPVEVMISKIFWMGHEAELISIRDISNWKRIEKELVQSKELYSGLFRNSTMGLYQTTPEGAILLVNPAIVNMLGYNSLGELQKRDLSERSYVDNSKRDQFKKLLEEKGEVTGFESEWLTKTGEVIYVNEGAIAIRNSEGDIIRYDGAVVNVTEQKKVELELILAKEKAEESDHLKSTFLATMSHELRTPLNAIIGFSDLLKESVREEDRLCFSDMINNCGYHLHEIFEDMFSLSLIESDQLTIEEEYFEIEPFLTEIWRFIKKEQFRLGYENLNLHYHLHQSISNQKILTDKNKLKQILIHILKNALKYTNQGDITFLCLPDIQKDRTSLKFEVHDTGIGINEADQKVIFDSFRQLNDSYSRKVEGTGIGLFLSKNLANLLGGSISVESVLDEGSQFIFTLPYRIIESQQNVNEPTMLSLNWEDKTILVAEDDYSNFKLIKNILHPTASKVVHAVSGREAVNIFEKNNEIDLVLMDIRMPIMNGFEATRAIKHMNHNFPVIILTSHTDPEEKEKALAAGCDAYISKPINVEKLYTLINSYLKETVVA